ncbi:MAG: CDP-paratose 2-epimerase [Bradymonadales bacterium]|nr:MAG: CDP-paratose 2-epimerase [Bradymonadales bacterium]
MYLNMRYEKRFRSETWIPKPVEEVFSFFSDAKNLEKITPPFLNFKVLSQSTEKIQEGTIFDYQLKVRGIPLKWRSRIQDWARNQHFVDTQLKGPYAKWVHLHKFISEDGGTRMIDQVDYALPLGLLGRIAAGWYVDRDVKKIFEYREKVIHDYFGKA